MNVRVKLPIILIVAMLPSLASAECLNHREARKKWPDTYLSWRGDHCWFAPHKHKEVYASEATTPSKEEKPSSPEEPVHALLASEPVSVVAPPPASVLTAEALVQHYIDTTLANSTAEVIEQVKAEVPPVPAKPLSMWESAMVATMFFTVLSGVLLAASIFFVLLGRRQRKPKERHYLWT